MKADIDFPKVERVSICAVPEEEEGAVMWRVHLINQLDEPISNVLISARGYGKQKDEEVKTSELRHYFELIEARSSKPVEMIPDNLRGLNNQYWVSFYLEKKIYDKKFIFLPDTLLKKNLVDLPILDRQGILIL